MQNINFTINKIVEETPGSKTFYLSAKEKIIYQAGQFLTFLINLYGKDIRRSYSLGSTPGVDDELCITIKRIENGAVSRYFFDHLQPGDQLTSLQPSGRFVIDRTASNTFVFIAAGSGIIPIFSLIKQVLFQQANRVVLIYQNTDVNHSIYHTKLHELKLQFDERFTLVQLFSKPSHGVLQRLNNMLLEKIINEQKLQNNPTFYLCGPSAFMRLAEFTLRVLGFDKELIHKENFVIDFIPHAPFMVDTSPKKVVIHFNNQTHQLQVAYPQNILQAALKNNIQLPYSCRGGRCSTCAATCTSGKIKMSINDVLTEKDLANGLILTCVAYPESDVEITVR
jgi:ring-1,2-phenylacetyl-CoA epoxidase subunit PaaE